MCPRIVASYKRIMDDITSAKGNNRIIILFCSGPYSSYVAFRRRSLSNRPEENLTNVLYK